MVLYFQQVFHIKLLELFLKVLNFSSFNQSEEQISDEETIILKAQKSSHHFGPLYEKYYDQIFVFINRRVDNLSLTAELTSNVFFIALKQIHKYESRGLPFSAWLYRIAINEVNQYFRKQKNATRSVNLEDRHIKVLFHEMNYDELMVDRHKLITFFLEQTNEDDLLLLELRYFEKRSFQEIGFLLEITANNAKVKTYRVIDKLKKIAQSTNLNDFKWEK